MTAKQMILKTDVDFFDGQVEGLMKQYARQETRIIRRKARRLKAAIESAIDYFESETILTDREQGVLDALHDALDRDLSETIKKAINQSRRDRNAQNNESNKQKVRHSSSGDIRRTDMPAWVKKEIKDARKDVTRPKLIFFAIPKT